MTILITGASGLVGQALISHLSNSNIQAISPARKEVDFLNKEETEKYFQLYEAADGQGLYSKIKCVFHLAARVGGVKANTDFIASFYDENIAINTNVLAACLNYSIPKVVSVLSTCVYPDAPYISYPLTEDQLHLGPPHDSNFGYAYAKRMLDVQTRTYRKQYGVNYITVIPNNLFGEHDNFHLQDGHVIPALMRKIWEAKLNNKPQ